jgi:hypothetical protein
MKVTPIGADTAREEVRKVGSSQRSLSLLIVDCFPAQKLSWPLAGPPHQAAGNTATELPGRRKFLAAPRHSEGRAQNNASSHVPRGGTGRTSHGKRPCKLTQIQEISGVMPWKQMLTASLANVVCPWQLLRTFRCSTVWIA